MLKVGIVGGTGYTGAELIRLLHTHPEVDVEVMTSRGDDGIRVDELFPSLRGYTDIKFTSPENPNLKTCDVVFFATPNGVAMRSSGELLSLGIKVIDLSADFRINAPLSKRRMQDSISPGGYGPRSSKHKHTARAVRAPENGVQVCGRRDAGGREGGEGGRERGQIRVG